MLPTSFDEANAVLNAPPGTEDTVIPLNVLIASLGEQPVVLSCWKLTPEELEEVNRTARIWLLVMGRTMLPVQLSGIKPPITIPPDDPE